MMNDQELHRELRGTTWEKYSTEIVAHYHEMLEKLAPRYAKIKKSMNLEELSGEEKEEEEA